MTIIKTITLTMTMTITSNLLSQCGAAECGNDNHKNEARCAKTREESDQAKPYNDYHRHNIYMYMFETDSSIANNNMSFLLSLFLSSVSLLTLL